MGGDIATEVRHRLRQAVFARSDLLIARAAGLERLTVRRRSCEHHQPFPRPSGATATAQLDFGKRARGRCRCCRTPEPQDATRNDRKGRALPVRAICFVTIGGKRRSARTDATIGALAGARSSFAHASPVQPDEPLPSAGSEKSTRMCSPAAAPNLGARTRHVDAALPVLDRLAGRQSRAQARQ